MKIIDLKQKRDNVNATYSDQEVSWLLENIGNEKSTIRDDLVCNSLGNGFLKVSFL